MSLLQNIQNKTLNAFNMVDLSGQVAAILMIYKDVMNVGFNAASALPHLGIAKSVLGLATNAAGMAEAFYHLYYADEAEESLMSKQDIIEYACVNLAETYAFIQLINACRTSLSSGSLSAFYFGMVVADAVSLVDVLFSCMKLQQWIDRGGYTRHTQPDLFESRDKLYRGVFANLNSCAGWTLLATGHPAAPLFLAMSALTHLRKFQTKYAPNMFSFFNPAAKEEAEFLQATKMVGYHR